MVKIFVHDWAEDLSEHDWTSNPSSIMDDNEWKMYNFPKDYLSQYRCTGYIGFTKINVTSVDHRGQRSIIIRSKNSLEIHIKIFNHNFYFALITKEPMVNCLLSRHNQIFICRKIQQKDTVLLNV